MMVFIKSGLFASSPELKRRFSRRAILMSVGILSGSSEVGRG